MATVRLKVVADKVKSQVANALAAIQHMVKDAFKQPFGEATLCTQWRVCTLGYDVLEHEKLDQTKIGVLGETTNKHVEKYSKPAMQAKQLARGYSAPMRSSPCKHHLSERGLTQGRRIWTHIQGHQCQNAHKCCNRGQH